MPSLVHIVGSVPLESEDKVFETVADILPGRLRCIPDGEVGERHYFVTWQRTIFPLEVQRSFFVPPGSQLRENYQLKLEDIKPTRWDEFAISSYEKFKKLQDAGKIAKGVRFQVCLPTPTSVVTIHLEPEFHEAAEPMYEKLLLSALKTIQDHIPHEDLAIQLDMPIEVAFMEHAYGTGYEARRKVQQFDFLAPYFSSVKEGIVQRASRIANAVALDVELGLHLCYGDEGHAHFVQPKDAGLMVELYNALSAAISRAFDWIHLPVPQDRKDDGYFEPIRDMHLGKTLLVLGLVHAEDEAGTNERIEVARRVLGNDDFAVSTECGLGRTPPEQINGILQICRAVTAA